MIVPPFRPNAAFSLPVTPRLRFGEDNKSDKVVGKDRPEQNALTVNEVLKLYEAELNNYRIQNATLHRENVNLRKDSSDHRFENSEANRIAEYYRSRALSFLTGGVVLGGLITGGTFWWANSNRQPNCTPPPQSNYMNPQGKVIPKHSPFLLTRQPSLKTTKPKFSLLSLSSGKLKPYSLG